MTGRPLRIAYINASLDMGGSERQMIALAQALPRDRFSVDFLLLTDRGVLADAAEAAGARVCVLGWRRRGDPYRRILTSVDLMHFVRAVRAGRYDVMDAWLFHAYAVGALTRPLTRIPILIAGRRSLSDFKVDFHPANRALDVLARRSCDAIVANSTYVRDDVAIREHLSPTRIRVIRNGVEIPSPMDDAERQAVRSRLGVEAERLLVGCVANLKPGKGHEAIIRAAAHLRASGVDASYALIGEGPLRPGLEGLVGDLGMTDRIHLVGHHDAHGLYQAMDVVVQASVSEGLPNVVLEAAAAGRPIVATAAGGTPEVVVDGETGLLVPVGDPGALEAGLRTALQDAGLRTRLGAAAVERASRLFGMDRFVGEVAALYEELAAARGIGRR